MFREARLLVNNWAKIPNTFWPVGTYLCRVFQHTASLYVDNRRG